MTNAEKAYIAGIIDGEGSIMLLRHKANAYPSPTITVASTTVELLEYLKKIIHAGNIRKKNNYNLQKHRNSFIYELRGDKAIDLLKHISPYLIISSKKSRAELIINKYKAITVRNGRYTQDQRQRKEDFYEEFIAIT